MSLACYAVDRDSGEVVEYAFEYESPLAARHAGLERLDELAWCPLRGVDLVSALRRQTAAAIAMAGRDATFPDDGE